MQGNHLDESGRSVAGRGSLGASSAPLRIRPPRSTDYDRVMDVMVQWWGGRDLRGMLPHIFFEHFRGTSLVAEQPHELVAFLVGFMCPDHPEEAYVHFCGVHPQWRRAGVARDLYRRFCLVARAQGRTVVRCVTAPVNKTSIAFHTGIGFAMLPGDAELDGLPVTADRGPQGDYVVRLELRLGDEPEGA